MAGIGFELKKIYRNEGISYAIKGALYSSLVTIGPTIVVIVTILLLYFFLGMTDVGTVDRELLSSTILYVFIFSVTLTAPFNSVFSRYLADKFYQEEMKDVLPSYYTGLLLVSFLAMLLALPMLLSMYFRGGVDLPFVLSSYGLWASAVIVFFSVTYLQATKDYKVIAWFFLIAMVIGGLLAAFLYFCTSCDQIHSILYGLTTAFFIIAFCEFAYIRSYFRDDSGSFTECLKYIWRYRLIFLTNLFYILGLYVHNFIFWGTPEHLYVANTFYSHQAYDMATCLAMFSNISTTVIFTVIAETWFHETYQKYMESVIGGTYRQIQKNKRIMFHTLSLQLEQVFSLQLAIVCVCYLFLHIFGASLGFSAMTMAMYPLLAVAFLGVFIMYCNIVYLYYFEATHDAMLTGFLFFIFTLIGTLISRNFEVTFYGSGLMLGMLVSLTFSFFCLRRVERNFEAHIFCRYKIIDTMKSSAKGKIVYRKGV